MFVGEHTTQAAELDLSAWVPGGYQGRLLAFPARDWVDPVTPGVGETEGEVQRVSEWQETPKGCLHLQNLG